MRFTKEQFAFFKARTEVWQEFFSLMDWSIEVLWEDEEHECTDCHAFVNATVEDMSAWVYVAKEWEHSTASNKIKIDLVVCHEVMEVLCYKAEELGDARYVRKGEMRAAVHEIINRISQRLVPLMWRNDK